MPSGFLYTVVTQWRNLVEQMHNQFCSENAYFSETRAQQASVLRCDALGKLQAMILSSYDYSGKKESSKQGMNSQKYD